MWIVVAFACQFGALVRRRPWRPTARPGGLRAAILSTKFIWSRRRGAWRFKRNSTSRFTHRLKQDSVATEELQRIMRSMLNGISYFFRPF